MRPWTRLGEPAEDLSAPIVEASAAQGFADL